MGAGPGEVRQVCTFRLAGRLFGCDVRDVKEVNMQTAFTRLPHAPPEVRGYVNLRGQIYLILDLRRLLGMPAAEVTAESRLVLFKPAVGESFGVVVDAVGDIVALPESQVEAWRGEDAAAETGDGLAAVRGELIAGVGKLEAELVVLLHAARMLRAVAAATAL